ncbi:DUF6600 domain-containing protein [Ferribacterium limneticum]|uniref:DUF6600 domain-containing protein n=1 Tax=Ferribacterium limneticum TaxID=76259 RepID=UPI001CF9A4D6|nr:DUF6600 domain-containing protein [Ferribacterium limneticum]UCV28427.1 hypothetical protein KI617_19665 [Ferribacterium limneticum]UCV32344.1 hypothetical protein KI608_19665 [Ferribacterium limneticum]
MMLQSMHRIIAATLCMIVLPAMAQNDPPARVGRLAHLENEVNLRVDRNDQGGPATINWPISSGAVLETGRRGRAEVWIGSTAYRLADDSQAEFLTVDDRQVDVRLNEGSLAVTVLDRDQVDDVMVVTPDGNVRFQTPGRYRVDVLDDHSELTVQAGRATFDDGRRVTPVAAGQQASRWGDGRERLDGNWRQDAFDQWVANRENATLASTARRHVSPHMTGYQDLDAYGDWQSAPDYGVVWYPRAVADDWAPYRYGRWAWVAPWGWTWIDQAPWGFAPFHYGRWAMIHGRWGWVPGRLVARPVYAPALVAWIGNPGWNVSFGFGAAPAVGWFPLAPREVYVPGHRHSHQYVRQINVSHVRDAHVIERAMRPGPQQAFSHHASPRAVTVVPANLVREGRPITAHEVRPQQRQELGRAPLASRAPNAAWLAPAPGAARPHDGERRSFENRQPRRDFDAPRPNAPERGTPRGEPMPRTADRPAFRSPMPEGGNGRSSESRPEILRRSPEVRLEGENRGRPVDSAPSPVPTRREASSPESRQVMPEASRELVPESRRETFRRPGEGRVDGEPRGRLSEGAPMQAPTRRDMPSPDVRQVAPEVSREPAAEPRREVFRRPAETAPGVEPRGRSFEAAPAPVPMRREMPPPEVRSEPRQPQSGMRLPEQRREGGDFQRMERPMQRESMPQQMQRQPEIPREMPRPAPPPEVRAPAPQPMPQAVQQQRAEPPRQPPAQAQPAGGGQNNDPRRRRDDERGPR